MPIIPEISSWFSSNVKDLARYSPSSLEEIKFPLQLNIGEKGREGTDIFQIYVASPQALEQRHRGASCVSGGYRLIVFKYDWAEIKTYLEKLVAACAGDTWEATVQNLRCHFHWEYDRWIPRPEETPPINK